VSIALDMLARARAGAELLGERRAALIEFFRARRSADGGYAGRSGGGDLYYSVFALMGLSALGYRLDVIGTDGFLRACADRRLDLLKLSCLARSWLMLERSLQRPHLGTTLAWPRQELHRRLRAYRAGDGGYAPAPRRSAGSAYAAFMALAAHQDVGMTPPRAPDLAASLTRLRTEEGGYANEPGLPFGAVPATAAVLTVQTQLGAAVDRNACRWLLAGCDRAGGFRANPLAPGPDLLSTATALFALRQAGEDIGPVRATCRAFVEGLWSPPAGFRGHAWDDALDCEYAFYGLLALGCL